MTLTSAAVIALVQSCAPLVGREALGSHIAVGNHFNGLAIGVNQGPKVWARTLADAVRIARPFINAAYSVDLGLAQIDHNTLTRLWPSIEQGFNSCLSLKAVAEILSQNFASVAERRSGVDTINAPWSLYNNDSATRWLHNGYVDKIWASAATLVPQMRAMLANERAHRQLKVPNIAKIDRLATMRAAYPVQAPAQAPWL